MLRLDLSWNLLTEVRPGMLRGLGRLRELYLERNRLTALSADTFAELTSLRKLMLQINLLSQIHREAFSGQWGGRGGGEICFQKYRVL